MINAIEIANCEYPYVASSNTYSDERNRDMFKVFGIYLIQNIRNNKFYIGSSCNVYIRIQGHFNNKRNSIFDRKIFKNEFKSKQLPIFNVCAIIHLPIELMDMYVLREIESYIITVLKPQYNKVIPHRHPSFVTNELIDFVDMKISQLKKTIQL